MAEQPHPGLTDYLLGRLGPEERAQFARHAETCPECARALSELGRVADLHARAAPPFETPAGLEDRTLAAVERAAAGRESAERAAEPGAAVGPGAERAWAGKGAQSARRRRRPLLPALGIGFAGAAVVVVAVLVGFVAGRSEPPGTVELQLALRSPDDPSRQGAATVRKTGIGRVVDLETSDLPELPITEQLYEVWFVAPDDAPGRPNRISAGTFHPDEEGRSRVRFAAAADPGKYPVLSITREPQNGDPRRSGPEVLSSRGR